MYIQPNTTVRLLTGVPLDNTYTHTLYFSDKASQTSYFESKTKAGCLLSNLSYQRYTKGNLRIQKLADDIYDCNYMMFQNTAYGNKWFYAFINNIEYVSNTVCEITYEIDVIQTWFFDVTLLQSFVEREHSVTDIAGENIVPEPVPIGEMYNGEYIHTGLFSKFDIVIATSYVIRSDETSITGYSWSEPMEEMIPGVITSGAYYGLRLDDNPTGVFYYAFNSERDIFYLPEPAPENPYSFFQTMLNKHPSLDDIAVIYCVPHSLIDYNGERFTLLNSSDRQQSENYERIVPYFNSHPTQLSHGYVPKNKKLLTYPYNKLVIDTADGNSYEYAFEFFEEYQDGSSHITSISFAIKGYRGANCSFRAIPLHYKGSVKNYNESCLLTDFPNVSIITDSYKAWYAQNKTRTALQVVSDIAGVGQGAGAVIAGSQIMTPRTKVLSTKGAKMMAGGYDEVGKSGVKGIGGTLAELADKSRLKYHPRVGSNDGSSEVTNGIKDFNGLQVSVNPQNAQIIDDFFNCYGYATHRVKVPNRNVRPHWTYVKTIDINLESNAPSDDTSKIASIYDNGITFWRHPSEVGNYSLDNSPS